jgi:hypothetical protein
MAQGTDGLSRGSFLEGVARGEDMLSFINLAQNAFERSPTLREFVTSWIKPVLGKIKILDIEEWFQEGQGIVGGERDHNGVWIPKHATNGRSYVWAPPPVIADVALEECMKAIHKRTDAYHVVLTPHLCSPLWLQMLCKLSDVVLKFLTGYDIGPLICMNLCSLVSLFLFSPEVPGLFEECRCWWDWSGNCNKCYGRNLLHKLLRTPKQLTSVSEHVARKLLRLPGTGKVPVEEDPR